MTIAALTPVLIAVVFGLVVAVVEHLIASSAVALRPWLARAWVYGCVCYIVLFGVIKV